VASTHHQWHGNGCRLDVGGIFHLDGRPDRQHGLRRRPVPDGLDRRLRSARLLLAPYLRKFGKFTVPQFIGDRFYSKTASTVAVICLLTASITYIIGQMTGVGVAFSASWAFPAKWASTSAWPSSSPTRCSAA
jgi:hypothetical protein